MQEILSNKRGCGFLELMILSKYGSYFPNHLLRRFRYSMYCTNELRYFFLRFLFFYILSVETEFQLYIEAQLIFSGNKDKFLFYKSKFLEVLFIESKELLASDFNESNALELISSYLAHLSMLWKMQHDCSLFCDTIITYNEVKNFENEQEDQETKKAPLH
jgi:hypothetical protein